MPRLAPSGPTSTKRSGHRKDPVHKAADYSQPWDAIIGGDPKKHYVYVPPNGKIYNQAYYESIGYEVELKRPGGPRAARGKTRSDGEQIMCMDCVLMSIDRDKWEAIQQFGVGGRGGQERTDRVEKTIIAKKGIDPMRGIHGDGAYWDVINQTAPAQETSLAQFAQSPK